jgi:Ankyrin repeat
MATVTQSSDSAVRQRCLWELADILIFKIVSYVAAPTHRATIVCHTLAPLCRAAHRTLLQDEDIAVGLWETILKEDYGVVGHGSLKVDDHSGSTIDDGMTRTAKRRRSCSRLWRTPVQSVRDAHRLMIDNTEIAYFYLSEMVNCNSSSNKLTRSRLVALLNEYGPHLRINQTVKSSGGVFLVEICRAKHVKATVILKCVQELVEQFGAVVNVCTSESYSSQMTPLAVAAVRGLPQVVTYLLQHGADTEMLSSGRFALHTQPKKSIRCRDQTPHVFCTTMRAAEKEAGATDASLIQLDKCLRLLSSA